LGTVVNATETVDSNLNFVSVRTIKGRSSFASKFRVVRTGTSRAPGPKIATFRKEKDPKRRQKNSIQIFFDIFLTTRPLEKTNVSSVRLSTLQNPKVNLLAFSTYTHI
jgi:hypothetical protein